MPNRIIKESINESRSLSEVSFFAEDLFKRLITYADDYGRFNADYQIILARLYPREIQIVSEFDIEDALIELSGASKIGFYTSADKKEIYGCFPNWDKHQRVRDSKNRFPEPTDTSVNDWYLKCFVPMKLKQAIIERDGFKCKMCGKYISTIQNSRYLIKMAAGLYHIDHVVSVAQGGRSTEENLQLTCPQCSLKRRKIFSVNEILEMALQDIESTSESEISHNVAASCGETKKLAAGFGYNPIRIQSESKQNPNARATDTVERFEEFLSAYPKYCNRYLTEHEYVSLLLTGKITEKELIQCAQNYAEWCKMEDLDERYIKNAENFLKETVFEKYLPRNYKKPAPKAGNKFNQFEQQDYDDYDISELEKDILSN